MDATRVSQALYALVSLYQSRAYSSGVAMALAALGGHDELERDAKRRALKAQTLALIEHDRVLGNRESLAKHF